MSTPNDAKVLEALIKAKEAVRDNVGDPALRSLIHGKLFEVELMFKGSAR